MSTTITLQVPATERFRKLVEVAAAAHGLPLSPDGLKVLDELYWAGGQLTTQTRQRICASLGMKEDALNVAVSRLRKKGFLKGDTFAPMLQASIDPAAAQYDIQIAMHV